MIELDPRYQAPRIVMGDLNGIKLDLVRKDEDHNDSSNGELCSIFDEARLKAEARELDDLHFSAEML